ncbi:MAG: protein kinase [Ruminococcus sp.]|jgi:serine/threonine protein kinase|nr:protein kinase [Ruminococcus sp.]
MNELILIDEKFPEFTIIESLSAGDTSRAYLAERDDTLYVIKEQPKAFCYLPNPEILKSLSHPGLPKIIEFSETDESYFYTYEYITGVTLSDAYTAGFISTVRAIEITEKLCDIVSYLHSFSLMHCDIKPENIILNGDDVYLIDFGIMRVYNKNSGNATVLVGTEGFVMPELGYKKTDFRADVYGLGMVMYYMLAGNTDIKNLSEKVPEKKLRKIIGKAASYEVNKRYKSPKNFAAVLKNYRNKKSPIQLGALITACLMFFAVGVCTPAFVAYVTKPSDSMDSIYEFQDALIEKAIRANLGKTDTETIFRYDLMSVEGVYFIGDMVFPNNDKFEEYKVNNQSWANTAKYGFISTTEDLKFCENIKNMKITYNTIEDFTLTPELKRLTDLDMTGTNITDISAITDMPALAAINLSFSSVKDLSPIKTCENLHSITISEVYADNYDCLIPGKTYEHLDFNNINYKKFYQYLNGITVRNLHMYGCGIESMDDFPRLHCDRAFRFNRKSGRRDGKYVA